MSGTHQKGRAKSRGNELADALTLQLRETAAWKRFHRELAPYLATLGKDFPDDVQPVLADVLVRLSMDRPWIQAWEPAAKWISRHGRPADADLVTSVLAAVIFAYQRKDPKAAAPVLAGLVKHGRQADRPQPGRGAPAARPTRATVDVDGSAVERVAAYQASPKWAQTQGIIEPFLVNFEGSLPEKVRWVMADVLSRLAAKQPWDQAFQPTVDWINGLRETRPTVVARMVELLATVVGAARPQDKDAVARVHALFSAD